MDNTLAYFVLGCGLAILASLLIGALVVVIVIRQVRHFVSPDTAKLHIQLDRMRLQHPELSIDDHIQAIIRQQALKCGLVGALTGLGGFITLPLALPVDLILSMRIQATMVQFVAMAYGQSATAGVAARVQTYLITSGTVEVTETTFNLIMKLVLRLLGESLAIFIPAIGAVIGFGVNYAIARTTGQVALRWYSANRQQMR